MLEITDHPSRPGSGDSGRIREIRLARPPVNALNLELLDKLVEAVSAAATCEAIVMTGQPGVFSAGLDVPGLLKLDREGIVAVFGALWRAQRAIAFSPAPVVFGITGHCPAGGTVLAIHADYRVLARGDFKLGLNEVQVGLYPGPLISGAFRRLVGGHAAQLLTRGALVDPEAALRTGLVDELVDPAQCAERALDIAREITSLPADPLRRTRDLLRQDLRELFGASEHQDARAREFAEAGAHTWFSESTQARLQQLFARKR